MLPVAPWFDTVGQRIKETWIMVATSAGKRLDQGRNTHVRFETQRPWLLWERFESASDSSQWYSSTFISGFSMNLLWYKGYPRGNGRLCSPTTLDRWPMGICMLAALPTATLQKPRIASCTNGLQVGLGKPGRESRFIHFPEPEVKHVAFPSSYYILLLLNLGNGRMTQNHYAHSINNHPIPPFPTVSTRKLIIFPELFCLRYHIVSNGHSDILLVLEWCYHASFKADCLEQLYDIIVYLSYFIDLHWTQAIV